MKPNAKDIEDFFNRWGSMQEIEEVLETAESLYQEEQNGFGANFSHYNWSRAQRAHMNAVAQLKPLRK